MDTIRLAATTPPECVTASPTAACDRRREQGVEGLAALPSLGPSAFRRVLPRQDQRQRLRSRLAYAEAFFGRLRGGGLVVTQNACRLIPSLALRGVT